MKKIVPVVLALALAVVPTLAFAQSNSVGAYCTSNNDCPGTNVECDTGLNQCVLTQAGVNQVLNNNSGGSVNTGSGGAGHLNTSMLSQWSTDIVSFINFVLVPLLTAVAFIVFLWGVFNYFIWGADNEDKRKEGKTFVMYGIIGFVIIFSLWGIVNVGTSLLNVGTGGRPGSLPYPTL